MVGERTLYYEATLIAEDYLGPAAPRFMARIIESHLGKKADEITSQDLLSLITWVKLSVSQMTDNEADINEFTARLNNLAGLSAA